VQLRKLSRGLRAPRASAARCGPGAVRKLDYGLRRSRKTRQGANHSDRDAQFRYTNDRVTAALASGKPVISVDTENKEPVGDFKNGGLEMAAQGFA
jgi:hypothetical protein